MKCPKCGTKCRDDAMFCPNCGQKLRDTINKAENENIQPKQPQPQPDYVQSQTKKTSKWGCGCAIIIVAVFLLIGAAIFGIYKFVSSQVESVNTNVAGVTAVKNNTGTPAGPVTPPEPVKVDINTIINDYINENSNLDNVSVSIVNNRTGEEYNSEYYYYQKAAWGFYLPVYYVYGNMYGYADSVATGIMSRDVSTCNAKGNEAISKIGGLNALNTALKNGGFTSTSFGKLFGQPASVGMNYTNTYDAVKMLKFMSDNSKEILLSNKINDFGIVAPSGATMYAQVGTENISKKENLNVFAVIKSSECDYCVAIMTTDSQGHVINGLLQAIHDGMKQQ